jgi:diguanylate cyclase (GGDEF)-like protein
MSRKKEFGPIPEKYISTEADINRMDRLQMRHDARQAELEDQNRKLEEVAGIDPVTGLLNRRGFESAYEALALSPKKREADLDEHRGTAILYLDLDRFKSVNDTHGHHIGDDALRGVASFIRARLRAGDRAARLGGDEFAALLPETSIEEAEIVANDILFLVDHSTHVQGYPINISASIGVGTIHPALSLEEALKQADQAMYRAKEAGRDQVVVFGQELTT